MRTKKPDSSFAPQEIRIFILPITLGAICMIVIMMAKNIFIDLSPNPFLITYEIAAITYILINNLLIVRTSSFKETYGWLNSILSGIGLGMLAYLLPEKSIGFYHILIVFGIIAATIAFGRYQGYLTLLGIMITSLTFYFPQLSGLEKILEFISPFLIAIIVMEIIIRILNITQQHIHRLETINKVSRQITLTLNTEQAISLLNATIQDSLEADTYFVGVLKGGGIQLDLFYDDGEYYNGIRIPLEGTLSGWVIRNQKELFLPDLRKSVELEGVENIVIGDAKTSLSWIGVPLKAENVTGIIALGSYTPNTFDQADMELLSSLAQHITLALDNTIRHAQVEEQARIDSLTGVYNHGSFLKQLDGQAELSSITKTPLSLIMLDIDYFKQYNDTHGHLVGDQILNALCRVIKQHIKQTDLVGRWGGEEFIISLPGANGLQANQVAKRIGETMALLRVEDRDKKTVPVPTVSQGIAVFPAEADEIYRLIDLADRRLYVAKERGRNQIEPNTKHWE